MKIGIDIRSLGQNRTGDETYTRELIRELLAIDTDNRYLLLTDTSDATVLANIADMLDLEHHPNAFIVPIFPAAKALWTLYSLPRYLAHHPVDLLHVQYITPQWIPRGVKLVTTIHDISFHIYRTYIKRSDLLLLDFFIPRSMKRADAILAVSSFTREEIMKHFGIPPEKITAIANGGAAESFFHQSSVDQQATIKAKYDLPEQYVLYIGTLQPRKNIPFLIQSFVRCKITFRGDPRIDQLHLVLIGNRDAHNYDRSIDTTISRISASNPEIIPFIHFPGFIDQQDLPTVYQTADGMLSASRYEGFNLPLVEAMASRVPVICENNPLNREVAGDAALMFETGDMDQFGQHIALIMNNPAARQAYVDKGVMQARQYSWRATAQNTLAAYRRIVGG